MISGLLKLFDQSFTALDMKFIHLLKIIQLKTYKLLTTFGYLFAVEIPDIFTTT